MKRWTKLMMDSGAFTVWRQGESIDLDAYITYLQKKQHLLESYVNLDVMPGQPGAARTPQQTERAAEAGWNNYLRMRKADLRPIHVFHMGERFYWLEKMLDEGCDYVGLSTNITLPTKQKRAWLDECFGLLCGSKGYPEVKVHGFGITAVSLMLSYPWTTTDSVTWMKQAVNGSIYVPRPLPNEPHCDGPDLPGYDYNVPPFAIGVSVGGRKGPSAQQLGNGTHITNCGRETKRYVLDYFKHEGMELEDLVADYEQRMRLNARFFKRVTKNHVPAPFYQQRRGLFATTSARGAKKAVAPFRLVLSVGTYLEYANILREESYPWQLISYHRVITGQKFNLKEYVTTGWFVRNSMRGKKRPWDGGRCGGPMQRRPRLRLEI